MWISARLLLLVVVVVVMIDHVVVADKCKKTLRTVFFERCRVRSKRSYPFTSESGHHHMTKRQIMSFREIFVASRVPYYHSPYSSYARHEYAPPVPPSASNIYSQRPAYLPQESHSHVGFDMTHQEMIEVFNELYDRLPRGTKSREEMQNEFLSLFEECCKNIDACRAKNDFDCPYN